MRLYSKYVSIQLKSAFEYRTSYIFETIASTFQTLVTLSAILVVFMKYEKVGGYTLNQVLITYSMIVFTFSFATMVFRGFDAFDKLIITGELDRLLIRPRSIFMQVLGYKMELNRMGRVLITFGVLVYSLATASIVWTTMKVVTLVLMVVCSILLFLSLFLIYSGICIFTVQGLEVLNVFINGGKDLSEYPIDIYSKIFRVFFTYIIPFGCVNYLPLQYLLGFSNANLLYALSPLFVVVFFLLCYGFFRWALTKYKSTGS